MLGKLYGVALKSQFGDAAARQVSRVANSLSLAPELAIALDLGAEPRRTRVQRL